MRCALTQANVNAPKGNLNGTVQTFQIGTNDQLADADEYRSTIISYKNGAPVRLGDIAKVVDGVENDQLAAWANGKPAVLLDIRRQPGANIVRHGRSDQSCCRSCARCCRPMCILMCSPIAR